MLKRSIDEAGSQSAWARREGVNRTHLCRALAGEKSVRGPKILKALKIKTIYVSSED
jgi:hypothetical protein